MAETEDGAAPATEEDEATTAETGAGDDATGPDVMAEVEDGAASATEEDEAATAEPELGTTRPASMPWWKLKTAPNLPRGG